VGPAISGDHQALGELVGFGSYRSSNTTSGPASVICTTNAIESTNASYRRAVRAMCHFPNEAAALKYLYLVTGSPDPDCRWQSTLGDRPRNPFTTPLLFPFAGRFERTNH
jgi:transposase-like protein